MHSYKTILCTSISVFPKEIHVTISITMDSRIGFSKENLSAPSDNFFSFISLCSKNKRKWKHFLTRNLKRHCACRLWFKTDYDKVINQTTRKLNWKKSNRSQAIKLKHCVGCAWICLAYPTCVYSYLWLEHCSATAEWYEIDFVFAKNLSVALHRNELHLFSFCLVRFCRWWIDKLIKCNWNRIYGFRMRSNQTTCPYWMSASVVSSNKDNDIFDCKNNFAKSNIRCSSGTDVLPLLNSSAKPNPLSNKSDSLSSSYVNWESSSFQCMLRTPNQQPILRRPNRSSL